MPRMPGRSSALSSDELLVTAQLLIRLGSSQARLGGCSCITECLYQRPGAATVNLSLCQPTLHRALWPGTGDWALNLLWSFLPPGLPPFLVQVMKLGSRGVMLTCIKSLLWKFPSFSCLVVFPPVSSFWGHFSEGIFLRAFFWGQWGCWASSFFISSSASSASAVNSLTWC